MKRQVLIGFLSLFALEAHAQELTQGASKVDVQAFARFKGFQDRLESGTDANIKVNFPALGIPSGNPNNRLETGDDVTYTVDDEGQWYVQELEDQEGSIGVKGSTKFVTDPALEEADEKTPTVDHPQITYLTDDQGEEEAGVASPDAPTAVIASFQHGNVNFSVRFSCKSDTLELCTGDKAVTEIVEGLEVIGGTVK
ncbi:MULTISPECIES: hypothetical protein [unclassified Mesorhizobium]|uniref:hypothetical protein n=1 Tax=unclassified Mesorhizobium TaxID=325217 RepID=UPI0003CEFDDD|nr:MULTISPECIES: hypothetical protein [unclassified Mesorhizobium]ESY09657.1 hypothetical protein X751_31375 [Mesorhizobium sp. LNJC395A00]WJI76707.1 hypothetical protein NLY37_08385 [Mesorhizobium sp. C395A]